LGLEGRKRFFFEKKKQKTFSTGSGWNSLHAAGTRFVGYE
jgi:hypothetical protein